MIDLTLIDNEIAKYENWAKAANDEANFTRDGYTRTHARECALKAQQWRKLRDEIKAAYSDG